MKVIKLFFSLILLSVICLQSQVIIDGKSPSPLSSIELKTINYKVTDGEAWENKISPVLKMSFLEYERNYTKSSFSVEQFIEGQIIIALYKSLNNSVVAPVLIKTNKINSTRDYLKTIGGAVQTEAGDIITAEIPLSRAVEIAQREEVIYIDGSAKRNMYMDLSRVECKADAVHIGTGLPRGFRGNGVVVGVVDSGIDWKHNDFKDGGGTRIKYLWDMSGASNPPQGYSYGTEYTKAQMDAGQCQAIDGMDGHGHGTHVAGTAAGNGNAISNYIGIAPESDIIFVKGFRSGPGFDDADVVNGCNYIFSKAQSMNKPAVINLSLGGHYGAHDGTSLYEQALSNLPGAGKIIVAAAGNEGESYIHLSYTTGGTNAGEARQSFWLINENEQVSAVDLWYNAPGQMAVGLAIYDQFLNLLNYTNPILPGQKIEDVPMTAGGFTYGYVTIDATTTSDPNNGARRVVFVIGSNNGTVSLNNCYWTLYTYGSGTLHAWNITGGRFSTDNNPPQYYPGNNSSSIGIPGTAKKIICIGSHVTKNQWVDMDGVLRQQPGNPTIGDKSSFSSMGPTRDARVKPDITAPGEVIVSAFSSDLPLGTNGIPRSNVVQGGKHQKMQGTSMASPHVTGAVALMLERNRQITYDNVYSILTTSTKKDAFTGTTQNNLFGFGKLDVQKSMQNTPIGTGVDDETLLKEFSLEQNYPNPFNPSTVIQYSVPSESVVKLEVFDLLGQKVSTLINEYKTAGKYQAEVNMSANNFVSGVYFYRLTAGKTILSKKMMLIK